MKRTVSILGSVAVALILIGLGVVLIVLSDGSGYEEVIALPVAFLFMLGIGIIATLIDWGGHGGDDGRPPPAPKGWEL